MRGAHGGYFGAERAVRLRCADAARKGERAERQARAVSAGAVHGARRRTVGVPSGGASQWGVRYSAASHQLATAADACWEKLIVLLQARWSVAIGGHAARGHARAALARGEVCVLGLGGAFGGADG